MKSHLLGAFGICHFLLTVAAVSAVPREDNTKINDIPNDPAPSNLDKRGEWADAYNYAYTWTGAATASQASETGQKYDWYGRPIADEVDFYGLPISARAMSTGTGTGTGTRLPPEGLEDHAKGNANRGWAVDHGEEWNGNEAPTVSGAPMAEGMPRNDAMGHGDRDENGQHGPGFDTGTSTGSWDKRDEPPTALEEFKQRIWGAPLQLHPFDGKCHNRFYDATGSMNPEPGFACTFYAEPNCAKAPRPPGWAMLLHDDEAGKDYLTSYWDERGFLVDVENAQGGPGSFFCQRVV